MLEHALVVVVEQARERRHGVGHEWAHSMGRPRHRLAAVLTAMRCTPVGEVDELQHRLHTAPAQDGERVLQSPSAEKNCSARSMYRSRGARTGWAPRRSARSPPPTRGARPSRHMARRAAHPLLCSERWTSRTKTSTERALSDSSVPMLRSSHNSLSATSWRPSSSAFRPARMALRARRNGSRSSRPAPAAQQAVQRVTQATPLPRSLSSNISGRLLVEPLPLLGAEGTTPGVSRRVTWAVAAAVRGGRLIGSVLIGHLLLAFALAGGGGALPAHRGHMPRRCQGENTWSTLSLRRTFWVGGAHRFGGAEGRRPALGRPLASGRYTARASRVVRDGKGGVRALGFLRRGTLTWIFSRAGTSRPSSLHPLTACAGTMGRA